MFTRSNFELKVGIFIFIGLVILSVIIFSIGNFYSIKRGYTLNVVFNFANGINKGAPVRYAGVEVGEVQDVAVYFDQEEDRPMVNLLLWVSQNTLVNEDAKATINTLGLLGEKYLEIVPGTKESKLVGRNGTLRGQDPISTEELTRETKSTLAKIDKILGEVNEVVGNEETKASLKEIVANIEKITFDLREVVAQAKEGRGTVGRFMTDDSLYNHIDEMILDIKKNPWKLLNKPKDWKKRME
ncbi:MAG: MlaD family protein [Candidatus Omnitrophota bacterium]